ncbi:MAG: hypothetical protein ACUVQ8_06175 [Nitrososphaeria archaeon]
MAYLKGINVKSKVRKRRNGKGWMIVKIKGKTIFVGKTVHGSWSLNNAYRRMRKSCFLSLGDVKYQLLSHLNKRKDIEIIQLETRRIRKREKGTGLKVTVRKHKQNQ